MEAIDYQTQFEFTPQILHLVYHGETIMIRYTSIDAIRLSTTDDKKSNTLTIVISGQPIIDIGFSSIEEAKFVADAIKDHIVGGANLRESQSKLGPNKVNTNSNQ